MVGVLTVWLLSPFVAYAALQRDASLEITIGGIQCTADQVYDIVPSYIINPEDCDKEEVIQRIRDELPVALPPAILCAAGTSQKCEVRRLPVDTVGAVNQNLPAIRPETVALAVGLGAIVIVVDQVALNGLIGQAAVRGGSRLIAFLKSLLRL